MCDLKNLTRTCGSENPPGTRAKLYAIPAEEITAHPQTKAALGGTAAGDTKVLGEAWSFVPDSGKGFWRTIDIIVDSGQETFSMVGERGGRSFENGLAFMLAGMSAENREFAECIAHGCWMFMIKDREDANPVVYGRFDDPAYAKEISGDGGKQIGDTKAISFVIGDSTGKVPFKYDSALAINLTPNA